MRLKLTRAETQRITEPKRKSILCSRGKEVLVVVKTITGEIKVKDNKQGYDEVVIADLTKWYGIHCVYEDEVYLTYGIDENFYTYTNKHIEPFIDEEDARECFTELVDKTRNFKKLGKPNTYRLIELYEFTLRGKKLLEKVEL